MANITAWHGKTEAEHLALSGAAAKTGYRFLSISIYGGASNPAYAAVMIKRPNIVAQRAWSSLSLDQFNDISAAQAKEGYGPAMLAATGSAAYPLFAVVSSRWRPPPADLDPTDLRQRSQRRHDRMPTRPPPPRV